MGSGGAPSRFHKDCKKFRARLGFHPSSDHGSQVRHESCLVIAMVTSHVILDDPRVTENRFSAEGADLTLSQTMHYHQLIPAISSKILLLKLHYRCKI